MYVIEVPFLDLDQMYEGPQPLRWIKLRDGMYVVQDGKSSLKVEQQKGRLIMNCTEDEFYDKWFHYFDMETDYAEAYHAIIRQSKFLKVCAVRSGGVRIIKQDLFECIIASIVKACCSDPNACRFVLNSFAHMCGVEHKQSIRGVGKITWYEFPTPEAIIENIDKFILGTKERSLILSVCEYISEGWLDLDFMKYMTSEEAKLYLSEFIEDSKVLDFMYLFGLHDLNWLPRCKFEDKVKQLKMKDNFGLIYAYVMHHKLNPPKNMVSEMKVGEHRWG